MKKSAVLVKGAERIVLRLDKKTTIEKYKVNDHITMLDCDKWHSQERANEVFVSLMNAFISKGYKVKGYNEK